MTPRPPTRPPFWQRVLRAVRPARPQPGHRAVHEVVYEGVLGTSLHLHLTGEAAAQLQLAERVLFDEIARLEGVFSRFDRASELNRWLSGERHAVLLASELGQLLHEALDWQRLTRGAFNPASDALSARWRAAQESGEAPGAGELAALVEAIQPPTYQLAGDGQRFTRTSALPLNFNAFAKGRIVDRAAAVARAVPGVRAVLLNIGGDLRHLGEGTVRVGIADPFGRADNAPPVDRLRVQGQAVATSGGSWRGFRVGERWYSHVLDPRSGWPAERVAGVSVLADDAATADVLATALSVLDPQEGLALAGQVPRVGCRITTAEHGTHTNAFWRAHRA